MGLKQDSYHFLFSLIIGHYGSRLYPKFESALPYLLASLHLQLQNLNLAQVRDFSNFRGLNNFEEIKFISNDVIHFITTTNPHSYPNLLEK